MNDLANRNPPHVARTPSSSALSTSSDSDIDSSDEIEQRGQRLALQVPREYRSIAPLTTTEEIESPVLVSSLNAEEIGSSSNDLWAIRLPSGIKPKNLANLTLDLRSLTTSTTSTTKTSSGPHKVGDVKVGEIDYDVFAECIPSSEEQRAVGALCKSMAPETKEMAQLVPFVPDQRKDLEQTHMVVAPRPVSRVIFFRRRLELPTCKTPTSLLSPPRPKPPVSKRPQPIGLETRNVPFGAGSSGVRYDKMDRGTGHKEFKRVKTVIG